MLFMFKKFVTFISTTTICKQAKVYDKIFVDFICSKDTYFDLDKQNHLPD